MSMKDLFWTYEQARLMHSNTSISLLESAHSLWGSPEQEFPLSDASLPEVSPVKISQSLEKGQDSTVGGLDSGIRCSESSGSPANLASHLNTSSSKTLETFSQ